MRTSNKLLLVSGYFTVIWYLLSLLNALKGISINSDFTAIHAIGALIMFFVASVFAYIEEK